MMFDNHKLLTWQEEIRQKDLAREEEQRRKRLVWQQAYHAELKRLLFWIILGAAAAGFAFGVCFGVIARALNP